MCTQSMWNQPLILLKNFIVPTDQREKKTKVYHNTEARAARQDYLSLNQEHGADPWRARAEEATYKGTFELGDGRGREARGRGGEQTPRNFSLNPFPPFSAKCLPPCSLGVFISLLQITW